MRLRRGLALAAGIAALVLLLAALAVAVLMQPERLARLVLGSVGGGLGLQIDFEGRARYRLRGTPMLEVRDVVVRSPGGDAPLLRASRVLVSLPWSTVRKRSAPLVLHRIELDSPVLDLPRLQEWLASRPPGDGRLPTLSEGITASDGRVLAEGWELRGLALRVPHFAGDAPLAAHAGGSLLMAGPVRARFDLHVAATRPADGAGIGMRGRLRLEGEGWQLPAFVSASGPLHSRNGAWHVAPLRFGASAEYRGAGEPLPFGLGVHGPLRIREGTWTLVPATVALRGGHDDVDGGIVPVLDARGRAALGRALLLEFSGAIPEWPAAWPALPLPLAASATPIAIELAYAGARDLSDPVTLRMERDDAWAEADGRVADVFEWMDAAAGGNPLPPLRARAGAPRIEVPGGVLHGVELGIEPGDGAP